MLNNANTQALMLDLKGRLAVVTVEEVDAICAQLQTLSIKALQEQDPASAVNTSTILGYVLQHLIHHPEHALYSKHLVQMVTMLNMIMEAYPAPPAKAPPWN